MEGSYYAQYNLKKKIYGNFVTRGYVINEHSQSSQLAYS